MRSRGNFKFFQHKCEKNIEDLMFIFVYFSVFTEPQDPLIEDPFDFPYTTLEVNKIMFV